MFIAISACGSYELRFHENSDGDIHSRKLRSSNNLSKYAVPSDLGVVAVGDAADEREQEEVSLANGPRSASDAGSDSVDNRCTQRLYIEFKIQRKRVSLRKWPQFSILRAEADHF